MDKLVIKVIAAMIFSLIGCALFVMFYPAKAQTYYDSPLMAPSPYMPPSQILPRNPDRLYQWQTPAPPTLTPPSYNAPRQHSAPYNAPYNSPYDAPARSCITTGSFTHCY